MQPGLDILADAATRAWGGLTGKIDREMGETREDLPLDTVLVARVPVGFAYLGAGLSDLVEKTTEDPALSGWGYEPSIVLVGTGKPPRWPSAFLQMCARYTTDSRRVLVHGDHVPARSTIAEHLVSDPPLVAFLCIDDPEIGVLDGPFGRVHAVRLVGIFEDEMLAVRTGRLNEVLVRMLDRNPKLVTDPARTSVLSGSAPNAGRPRLPK